MSRLSPNASFLSVNALFPPVNASFLSVRRCRRGNRRCARTPGSRRPSSASRSGPRARPGCDARAPPHAQPVLHLSVKCTLTLRLKDYARGVPNTPDLRSSHTPSTPGAAPLAEARGEVGEVAREHAQRTREVVLYRLGRQRRRGRVGAPLGLLFLVLLLMLLLELARARRDRRTRARTPGERRRDLIPILASSDKLSFGFSRSKAKRAIRVSTRAAGGTRASVTHVLLGSSLLSHDSRVV